jgi:hypothetical protein
MSLRIFIASGLMLAACACATAPNAPPLHDYLAALAGAYDNSAQYNAAPATLKRTPASDASYEWLDQQYGVFEKIDAPNLGPHALYVEWREGGPDGAITRQRVWLLRTDQNGAARMDIFAFKSPQDYAGKAQVAGAFGTLTPNDLTGYGPECGLYLTPRGAGAWDGRIEPFQCQVKSPSGKSMGLDMRVTIMPTGVLYKEAGILDDETIAFSAPGGPPYEFRRRP